MSNAQNIFIGLFLSVTVFAKSAGACMIQWQSPEELEKEAGIVVEAVVQASQPVHHSFRGNNFKYNVKVEVVERGNISPGVMEVTYEDMLMHRRGNMTVCPLKHGSGIEQDLKLNRRYKLYLRSITDPEILIARADSTYNKSRDSDATN